MPQHPFPSAKPEDSESAPDGKARSTLMSRNITVSGRRTSVRLEPLMWRGLHDICRREHVSLHEVCTHISLRKDRATSLTAAIRVYIMEYFRSAATEEGHMRARHGQGLSLDSGAPPHTAINSLAIVAGTAQALGKIEPNAHDYALGVALPSAAASR